MIRNNKYSFQVWINGKFYADLSDIAMNRQVKVIRNQSDEITFDLNLDQFSQYCTAMKVKPAAVLATGVAEIRVYRLGNIVSAGQLMYWEADLGDDNNRKISCHAFGWFELFKQRLTSNTYTNQTASFIAQDLISSTQSLTNGNYGVTIGVTPSPDMTNLYDSITYDNKSIYDAIVEMSQENSGFDFEITWDKKFNIYYPSIGSSRSDVIFTYPGNVMDIKISSDASKLVNSLLARGKGFGGNQISTTVSDSASQTTYFLRQGTQDYSDVADPTQLTNLANGELAIYKQPLTLHSVVFDPSVSGNPSVGALHIGDQIQVVVSQLLLYSDVNTFFKIDEIDLAIGDEGDEQVTLMLNQ